MEERIQKLELEVQTIKERNARVEVEKKWETSNFRIISLTALTYLIAVVVLYIINVQNFFLGALVPTTGFFISVQSLPMVKNWWIRKHIGNIKDSKDKRSP